MATTTASRGYARSKSRRGAVARPPKPSMRTRRPDSSPSKTTVGVIGLGIMGSAMATNLLHAGFRVVGYDVLPKSRSRHARAGGRVASSAREVGDAATIIVCSLPSSDDLIETANELAKSTQRTIVVETSTLPIGVKEEARAILASHGSILLDCPLSGTGAQARTRDLAVYASGDRGAYRRVIPVLE